MIEHSGICEALYLPFCAWNNIKCIFPFSVVYRMQELTSEMRALSEKWSPGGADARPEIARTLFQVNICTHAHAHLRTILD